MCTDGHISSSNESTNPPISTCEWQKRVLVALNAHRAMKNRFCALIHEESESLYLQVVGIHGNLVVVMLSSTRVLGTEFKTFLQM